MIILTAEQAAAVRGHNPNTSHFALDPKPLKGSTGFHLPEQVIDDPAHEDVHELLQSLEQRGLTSGEIYATNEAAAIEALGNPTWRDAGPRDAPDSRDYFAWDGATQPIYGISVYPAAVHHNGLTWFSWEALSRATNKRVVKVVAYDHTAERFGTAMIVGRNTLTNDDHGTPALVRDHQGRWHCFYGSHNTEMRHASMSRPDDNRSWVARTSISGSHSYPHPTLIGSTLYLFSRGVKTELQSRPLMMRKTTSLDDGIATWSDALEVIDFGEDSRFYHGIQFKRGTEIHITATRSPWNDSLRRDVYYFVYDTVTGSIRNLAGTFEVDEVEFPVSRSDCDAHYMIVDNLTQHGAIPGAAWVGDVFHIVYMHGKVDYLLKHKSWDGESWSDVFDVGTATTRNPPAVVPFANGDIDVYWSEDESDLWVSGGNIRRRSRAANGTWGSAATIATATDFALSQVSAVQDAHPDARLVFCEIKDANSDSTAGALKVFCHGDNGLLLWPEASPA